MAKISVFIGESPEDRIGLIGRVARRDAGLGIDQEQIDGFGGNR